MDTFVVKEKEWQILSGRLVGSSRQNEVTSSISLKTMFFNYFQFNWGRLCWSPHDGPTLEAFPEFAHHFGRDQELKVLWPSVAMDVFAQGPVDGRLLPERFQRSLGLSISASFNGNVVQSSCVQRKCRAEGLNRPQSIFLAAALLKKKPPPNIPPFNLIVLAPSSCRFCVRRVRTDPSSGVSVRAD